MEGVLSACYHVCPNYSNFQFGKYTLFRNVCYLFPDAKNNIFFIFKRDVHIVSNDAEYFLDIFVIE